MKLWRVGDEPRPVLVECPGRRYPAKDDEGETVYDNTHFDSEDEAWKRLLRDRRAALSLSISEHKEAAGGARSGRGAARGGALTRWLLSLAAWALSLYEERLDLESLSPWQRQVAAACRGGVRFAHQHEPLAPEQCDRLREGVAEEQASAAELAEHRRTLRRIRARWRMAERGAPKVVRMRERAS